MSKIKKTCIIIILSISLTPLFSSSVLSIPPIKDHVHIRKSSGITSKGINSTSSDHHVTIIEVGEKIQSANVKYRLFRVNVSVITAHEIHHIKPIVSHDRNCN